MLHRILVSLDGSTEAEAILSTVRQLVPIRSEVHFLHVVPELHGPVGLEATHRVPLHDRGATYLAATREKWLPQGRGLDLVRAGDPAEAIVGVALEQNIDLIAMTTHGRGGLQRFILGSVASTVVRAAQLPVLLTRPDIPGPARPVERILLGIEGTETPEDLLVTVRSLMQSPAAEIILFHAREAVRDPAPVWAAPLHLARRSPDEAHLRQLADRLEEQGFYSWPVLSTGDPAEEIIAQARKLDVDLIALSTHGRKGLDRVVEGSVAERVLHRSPVPVLLQKPLVAHPPAADGGRHA